MHELALIFPDTRMWLANDFVFSTVMLKYPVNGCRNFELAVLSLPLHQTRLALSLEAILLLPSYFVGMQYKRIT